SRVARTERAVANVGIESHARIMRAASGPVWPFSDITAGRSGPCRLLLYADARGLDDFRELLDVRLDCRGKFGGAVADRVIPELIEAPPHLARLYRRHHAAGELGDDIRWRLRRSDDAEPGVHRIAFQAGFGDRGKI